MLEQEIEEDILDCRAGDNDRSYYQHLYQLYERDRAAKQYPEWDSKAQKAFDMLNKHYDVDHARLELEMSKALETKDPTVKDQEFWTICSG